MFQPLGMIRSLLSDTSWEPGGVVQHSWWAFQAWWDCLFASMDMWSGVAFAGLSLWSLPACSKDLPGWCLMLKVDQVALCFWGPWAGLHTPLWEGLVPKVGDDLGLVKDHAFCLFPGCHGTNQSLQCLMSMLNSCVHINQNGQLVVQPINVVCCSPWPYWSFAACMCYHYSDVVVTDVIVLVYLALVQDVHHESLLPGCYLGWVVCLLLSMCSPLWLSLQLSIPHSCITWVDLEFSTCKRRGGLQGVIMTCRGVLCWSSHSWLSCLHIQ